MTHAAKIKIPDSVKSAWQSAREDTTTRIVILGMEKEHFTLKTTVNKKGDFEDDFSLLESHCDKKEPSYFLFRTDDEDSWIFMNHIPSAAKVRSRMLFASARDTCRNALGTEHFNSLYFGSDPSDFTYETYIHDTTPVDDSQAMSYTEQEVREENLAALLDVGTPSTLTPHVNFPLSSDAESALKGLSSGSNSCVILSINSKTEVIDLKKTGKSFDSSFISKNIPSDSSAFIFSRWYKDLDNEKDQFLLFIYWAPESLHVRKKMTASTVKSAALSHAAALGVTPQKRLEYRDAEDVDPDTMHLSMFPPKAKSTAFSKPKPKGGRAATRKSRRNRKS